MRIILAVYTLLFFCLAGCSPTEHPFAEQSGKKYILVYSSPVLSEAVAEIASVYEKSGGCAVDILSGGSAHQVRAIEISKKGDIFFTSVGEYADSLNKKGMAAKPYTLGRNRLVFYVAYGNPMGIDGNLSWLENENIRLVIGSYLTSGAGEQTHRTLQKAGILERVSESVDFLAPDTKSLLKSVADNEADLAVGWESLKYSTFSKGTQAIPIKSADFGYVPVKAAPLNFSAEKACAEDFLKTALSPQGLQIFSKYGIENKAR